MVFVASDAYDYIDERVLNGRRFDVVSADPPTAQFRQCAENLYLLCTIARESVILGTGHDTELEAPPGWTLAETRYRSGYRGGVNWTVLENVS